MKYIIKCPHCNNTYNVDSPSDSSNFYASCPTCGLVNIEQDIIKKIEDAEPEFVESKSNSQVTPSEYAPGAKKSRFDSWEDTYNSPEAHRTRRKKRAYFSPLNLLLAIAFLLFIATIYGILIFLSTF